MCVYIYIYESLSLSLYIYIYTHTYVCTHACVPPKAKQGDPAAADRWFARARDAGLRPD